MPGNSEKERSVMYFIGCDMGGWHTDDGDAIAICRWEAGKFSHVNARAGSLFFPVPNGGALAACIEQAEEEDARLVIGIDAALGWPVKFAELVAHAATANHVPEFTLGDSIDNPYLYRETERFVKRCMLTGRNERPLTAAGDKFGNNSSKAQALVGWLKRKLPDVYRPPFDAWDSAVAASQRHTLIEVYPAATMKCGAFCPLIWPGSNEDMRTIGASDIADAKRCAITAVCYAMTVRLIPIDPCYPKVVLPDDALACGCDRSHIQAEGWIFAPRG
jgi:hypothetical protein